MVGGSVRDWFETDELRRVLPFFSLAFGLVAALTQPSSAADLALTAVPVAAWSLWAFARNVPLAAVSVAIVVPVVAAQRTGELEPVMFNAVLLGFAAARWTPSLPAAVSLGGLAAATPVLVALAQDPMEIAVGIWVVAIIFIWVVGRAVARQERLVVELEEARRLLGQQELLTERRRIARDVHDFVGHGLAAVMLQVTSARHVLRRDPDAAEEALRSAEEVGRRSMQELRRTVTLLRSDDVTRVAAPVAAASEIPALVDEARAGGLNVELHVRGDLTKVPPRVGRALYPIAQEALANAARHAPRARTMLGLELANGRVVFLAETSGPLVAGDASERARPHYGLIGMQERATALGGEFEAGPTRDGWRRALRASRGRRGNPVIGVAIVDDQAIVRAGLARILSPADGFDVVAECADGRQAVDVLPGLRPDVVLMDVRMPALDGIAATAQLRGLDDPLDVLVLTTFGEDEVLWGVIEAGAAGFVLKDSSAEELIAAVRAVAGGAAWFDPAVAPRLLERYRRVVAPAARDAARLDQLTDREHDVLRLMARGATNAEIGATLFVAEATVKTHVGSIFGKLGVRDRAAAIVFAYDHGVVTPGVTPQ